jgi:DNA-binding CsgD family transcriptional regulator
MRQCPNCSRIFPSVDKHNYCRYDGTLLLAPEEASELSTLPSRPDDLPTLKSSSNTAGIFLHPKSQEMATQIESNLELNKLRAELQRSSEGVRLAENEVSSLLNHVNAQAKEISENYQLIQIQFLNLGLDRVAIESLRCGVKLSWQRMYTNSLRKSKLVVVEYQRSDRSPHEQDLNTMLLDLDVNPDFQIGWKIRETNNFITSDDLSRECINRLLGLLISGPTSSAEEGSSQPDTSFDNLPEELSGREKDVLRLLAWGYNAKEIALRLKIGVKSVDTYKKRLMEKLGLSNRVEIVQYAKLQGLLQEDSE